MKNEWLIKRVLKDCGEAQVSHRLRVRDLRHVSNVVNHTMKCRRCHHEYPILDMTWYRGYPMCVYCDDRRRDAEQDAKRDRWENEHRREGEEDDT